MIEIYNFLWNGKRFQRIGKRALVLVAFFICLYLKQNKSVATNEQTICNNRTLIYEVYKRERCLFYHNIHTMKQQSLVEPQDSRFGIQIDAVDKIKAFCYHGRSSLETFSNLTFPSQNLFSGSCSRENLLEVVVAVTIYHKIESRLRTFLENFNNLMLLDHSLNLVISAKLEDAVTVSRMVLLLVSEEKQRSVFTVFENSSNFSRGRLCNNGALEAARLFGMNATLLITDIDILISLPFIKRCQTLAIRSKSLYFPIVRSEKKPSNNHTMQSEPNVSNQLEDFTFHTKQGEGLWRKKGYGMVCANINDYIRLGGFPEFTTWGFEDKQFHKRAVSTSGSVIFRFNDPGLYHQWHEKDCSESIKEQHWVYWLLGIPTACESVKKLHDERKTS